MMQIKRTLMTRASFTGAFDESCHDIISSTPTSVKDEKNHCFVSKTMASKQVSLVGR
jgi:hypothetical protein